MTDRLDMKVAYIGGGSAMWTPHVLTDLYLREDLGGTVDLYDLNLDAAALNVKFSAALQEHPQAKGRWQVRATEDLATALDGADLVYISISPGPIDLMAHDINIPKRYGIEHAVADTAGPAGLVRALRAIPIYEGFARAIMENCPDAWVINLTNPMVHCTATLYAVAPEMKAYGFCHEVKFLREDLAEILREKMGIEGLTDPREIVLDVEGTNHFVCATRMSWRGRDLFPLLREYISREGFFDDRTDVARDRVENEQWWDTDRLIILDFFRRFGVVPLTGDRHLVEFVPWYLSSEAELHRWGVILTPASARVASRPSVAEREVAPVPEKLEHSRQDLLEQVCGLFGLGEWRSTANLPNTGQCPDLQRGAVVETCADFRHDALQPLQAQVLPPVVASMQRRVIDVQMATVEAGLKRDHDLAFQALLADPLVRIPTDKAWQMFNEMLQATADYLPGWDL